MATGLLLLKSGMARKETGDSDGVPFPTDLVYYRNSLNKTTLVNENNASIYKIIPTILLLDIAFQLAYLVQKTVIITAIISHQSYN